MKGFTLFLWPTLFVRPLLAAEPRGCIRPGTCPEYRQRMGDGIVATQRIARGAEPVRQRVFFPGPETPLVQDRPSKIVNP